MTANTRGCGRGIAPLVAALRGLLLHPVRIEVWGVDRSNLKRRGRGRTFLRLAITVRPKFRSRAPVFGKEGGGG